MVAGHQPFVQAIVPFRVTLTLLTVTLLLILLAWGLRRDRLSAGGLAIGTAMFLMVAVFVTLVTILIWRVATLWASARINRWLAASRPTPTTWLFFAALVALALAVFSYRYSRALREERLPDLAAGVLLNWLLALLLFPRAAPVTTGLFLWPLLAALPFLAWILRHPAEAALSPGPYGWLLALLPTAVVLLLWIPYLIRFFRAQALTAFFLLPGAVIFPAGLLLPLLAPLFARDRGLLAEFLFLVALLLFIAGWLA